MRAAAIEILIVDQETEDPVITVEIRSSAGILKVMGEPEWVGRRLVLRHVHMHGEDVGPNQIGGAGLLRLAQAALEALGLDEAILEGEVRTSGAGRGHRPRPLRFVRKLRPDR